MNSIVRIVLRGLLSGEIKPEPQVFERLKELSEARYLRHSRILRLARPSAGDVAVSGAGPTPPPSGGNRSREPETTSAGCCVGSASPRRDWPTLASVVQCRGIRRSAGLFVGGLVLVLGMADGAAVPSDGVATWVDGLAGACGTPSAAAVCVQGVVTATLGVANVGHPFPRFPVLVGGILLGGFLLRAGWRWYCRKWLFVMRPYEVALQELEAARFRAEHGKGTTSRRAVLDILRDYLRAQFRLSLPQLEHGGLQTVLTPGCVPLTLQQRGLLREVLESAGALTNVDPLRFAELTEKATRFVWATACCRPARR